MKSKTRDILVILVAVTAIYASGHGFGYIVGSKSGHSPTGEVPETRAGAWAEATMESLRSSLDLTPEQIELIRGDVEETAGAIGETRQRALLECHMLLLRLHDRITPKVDAPRQRLLRVSQEKLRTAIGEKFPLPESSKPD